MTILVADDHEMNRKLLGAILSAEGYQVQEARDGTEALTALQKVRTPLVALLDWQMPGLEGIDVCREARKGTNANLLFLVIVTVRDSAQDVVTGLQAGANDYITKPFNNAEVLARVRIGSQMVALQQSLARRVSELEDAMTQVKQLKGLLPICGYCKSIRADKNYWQNVEQYISTHTEASFSHSICPDCFEKHMKPQLTKLGLSEADVDKIKPPNAQQST